MPKLKLTAITPQHMPTTQEYVKALKDSVYKTASLTQRDLLSTTRTWEHKVQFDITITQQGDDYIVSVATDDKIYGWVDAGTKAHVILPKRSKYLAFSSGYRAKTRVGIIGSQAGGAFGPTVFAAAVHHPGFPGRKFFIKIAQRRQVTMKQEGDQAIAKVNRTMK